MSSLLRFLAIGLVLIAMLAQAGCQTRGNPSSGAPYHPSNVVRHTVVVGETLSSIAAKYGVSVATLVDANNIRDRNLRPGSVLQVPGGRVMVAEPTPPPPIVKEPDMPPVTAIIPAPRICCRR